MLEVVQKSTCTTHLVKDESEAIQMFIFQNNRGKKPSNLEIIKAQFMFTIHLLAGEEKTSFIEEIKDRFTEIYKSISSIEYKIDEDDVLLYTLRVYSNSLSEANALEKINKCLSKEDPIAFIKEFTLSLKRSFEHLTNFFIKDERDNIEIHSLITLGGFTIAIPFIIKAYTFDLSTKDICTLCSSFEYLVLRQRLIGTRADLTSRLDDVYKAFKDTNPHITPIIDKINYLKTAKTTDDWWWAYWNNEQLERNIQGEINHSVAKFILWKYENYLGCNGKSGYKPSRFDEIESPELEHIAPKTETNEKVKSGYEEYDEDFKKKYMNCLGNYLLLSKSHNCSIGNNSFFDKYNSYNYSKQQREIKEMVKDKIIWTKEHIQQRKDKIIDFILGEL